MLTKKYHTLYQKIKTMKQNSFTWGDFMKQ